MDHRGGHNSVTIWDHPLARSRWCSTYSFVLTSGILTAYSHREAIDGVHGVDEWVNLDRLRTVKAAYAATAVRFLGER
ncbi:MAG: hypothetical protein WCD86_18060 [Ktedonobacteraceae bacterium]